MGVVFVCIIRVGYPNGSRSPGPISRLAGRPVAAEKLVIYVCPTVKITRPSIMFFPDRLKSVHSLLYGHAAAVKRRLPCGPCGWKTRPLAHHIFSGVTADWELVVPDWELVVPCTNQVKFEPVCV
eukprot:725501-Rhodomonas_salina.1